MCTHALSPYHNLFNKAVIMERGLKFPRANIVLDSERAIIMDSIYLSRHVRDGWCFIFCTRNSNSPLLFRLAATSHRVD